MAVEVKIKQKGLFKKKIEIEDMLSNNLLFGVMDENFRMVPNEKGKYTIIYDPNNLARGLEVSFEKNIIDLRLPLPTAKSDIEMFYNVIKRICNKLKIDSFERYDEVLTLDTIDQLIRDDVDASTRALDDICYDKQYETITIFGALNPIAIGSKEKDTIKGSVDNFGKFLKEKQEIDAYYAAPKLYKSDTDIIGIYVITEKVDSIVPLKPKVIMNNENQNIKFYTIIGDGTNDVVKYEDFISSVDQSNYYDDEHIIINLSKKEIENILEKYKTEI